jgi:hypothetical protein
MLKTKSSGFERFSAEKANAIIIPPATVPQNAMTSFHH